MPPRKKIIKRRPVPENCIYCQGKTEPEYKDAESLGKYVSDRGKIIGRARTGICAKHQRRLTKAIKRARHLALLTFLSRV